MPRYGCEHHLKMIVRFRARSGLLLRAMSDASNSQQGKSVGQKVLAFYESLPFNQRESLREAIRNVKLHNPVRSYPPLESHVQSGRLLEVGSGVGWFSNGVAYHCEIDALGIDFNPIAVQQATRVSEKLKLKSKFQTADLFSFEPPERFDIVVSLGVLHHTADCEGAIRRIATRFIADDGVLLLGLYHKYGRAPFLEHFRRLKLGGASEDSLLQNYARLHTSLSDDVHLHSWFRDQVLHPHETQHTFKEVRKILGACGMKITSTSLNEFRSIENLEAIERDEINAEEISKQALREGRYFPGFFVVFAERS